MCSPRTGRKSGGGTVSELVPDRVHKARFSATAGVSAALPCGEAGARIVMAAPSERPGTAERLNLARELPNRCPAQILKRPTCRIENSFLQRAPTDRTPSLNHTEADMANRFRRGNTQNLKRYPPRSRRALQLSNSCPPVVELLLHQLRLDRCFPQIGRSCSTFDRLWLTLTNSWPDPLLFGPDWPRLAGLGPDLAKLGIFGPNSAKFGSIWANIDQTQPNSREHRPILAECGAGCRLPESVFDSFSPAFLQL